MPTSFTNSESGSSEASISDFGEVDLCRPNPTVIKPIIGQEGKHIRFRLSLDEICQRTNFTRKEVRAFYRTLKQVRIDKLCFLIGGKILKHKTWLPNRTASQAQ